MNSENPSQTSPLSVLILEDHPLLGQGLRTILAQAGYHVGDVVSSSEQALKLAAAHDVAVVDLEVEGGSGLEFIRGTRAQKLPCVVFSGHAEAVHVREALRAGALGYVRKSAPPAVLLEAIAKATAGERFLCESAAAVLAEEPPPSHSHVTARELEVLQLVAAGLTTKEIAAQLGISPRTVDTHRERLLAKFDAHNVVSLTRAAEVAGLIKKHRA